MLEHLHDHLVGLLHVGAGIAALLLGVAVAALPKGTRRHRRYGRAYLVAMVLMNFTALTIFELFGRFGPFHWLALFSLATCAAGFIVAWRRLPGWVSPHAYLMGGSLIGLAAAAVAEVATRVPGWGFGPAVLVSSGSVIALGLVVLFRQVPRAVRSSRAAP